MGDPDDDERFSGAFIGPDEGENAPGEPGTTATDGGDQPQAVPYVGTGAPENEDGAGDYGDGT
ncbi:hypothetical protein [Rhizomonospora bruguierae]|uniref:hypothetical protein n=1 Tax=Rhizomonospora bruguierae TaxID=1581705 RepID=UPI001BCB6FBA|nr:hypothetical protein [Micromonospora sp. NBRC 107566]